MLVRGAVPALAGVLGRLLKDDRTAHVPVAWEPGDDRASVGLARDLGVGSGRRADLSLVRDDHGGVLLHHGRIEADNGGRRSLSSRLGLQAHHDDIKVADGEITRIDVRPDWTAVDTIGVTVMVQPLRPTRRTVGRALQVASDPARVVRDGIPSRARCTAGPGTPTTGCAGAWTRERPETRLPPVGPVVDTGHPPPSRRPRCRAPRRP